MNWFSGTSWLWRAWRTQSITAAALFAFGILGLSVVRVFRHLLSALGVPWLLLFILPFVVISLVARQEDVWIPDPALRKRWSRGLILGAIGISILLAWVTPSPPPAPPRDSAEEAPVRMHRPSGK